MNRPGTPTTWQAVLKACKPGDVVQLAPGPYGVVKLSGLVFPGEVIVEGKGAIFKSLTVEKCSNLTFRNLEIDAQPGVAGVWVPGSSDIRFEEMDVHGVVDGNPTADGSGFALKDCQRITITSCQMHDLVGGISHSNVQGLTITENHFHHIRKDGVMGGNSNDVLISKNDFASFFQQPLDHPDCIQFWTLPGGPTRNLTITDNTYTRGEGGPVQGVFLKDEAKTGWENVLIARNAIVGGSYNAIYVTGAGPSVTVEDNLVVGFKGMVPYIDIRGAGFVSGGNQVIAEIDASQVAATLATWGKRHDAVPVLTLEERIAGLERWRASLGGAP